MLISIIVPIYNIKDYIGKCIESICNQTYKNIEIILVDDGSTDNSGSICDEYAAKDSRIVVIHKENGGLVSARQAGAKVATGDYITNVDGDDWIELDRIENLVNQGIMNDEDMVYMAGWIKEYPMRSEVFEFQADEGAYRTEEIYAMLADITCCFKRLLIPSMVTWAVRADLYHKIQMMVDSRITNGEDQVFVWLCLLEAKSVRIIKDNRYHYVQRQSSMTHTADEKNYEYLPLAYSIIKAQLDKHQVDDDMYKRLAFTFMRLMSGIDYGALARCSDEYLYPYTKVKKGSRVIIYGGGDNGERMIRVLAGNPDYHISGWVDKYVRGKEQSGVQVQGIEQLFELEYDYIVIAIVDYNVVSRVVVELEAMGIDGEKIAIMDPAVINTDMVKKCFEFNPE